MAERNSVKMTRLNGFETRALFAVPRNSADLVDTAAYIAVVTILKEYLGRMAQDKTP